MFTANVWKVLEQTQYHEGPRSKVLEQNSPDDVFFTSRRYLLVSNLPDINSLMYERLSDIRHSIDIQWLLCEKKIYFSVLYVTNINDDVLPLMFYLKIQWINCDLSSRTHCQAHRFLLVILLAIAAIAFNSVRLLGQ
ncbi:hypothetical protein BDC45DRAFT_556861 [Circinella umbellata]|nr:hypothetical protein BDC45DRAFT_556861 [Circinella umbellata]